MGLLRDIKDVYKLGGLNVKELGKGVLHESLADDMIGIAAQLAYYFLFSLFPFLLFLAALLAYIPIPNLLDHIMSALARVAPKEVLDLLQSHVRQVVTNQHGGLLSFGIVVTLWTASSALNATADGLNRAYKVRERRPIWKVYGMAILLTISLAVMLLASILLLMFGPQLGHWIANFAGLGPEFDFAWNLLRWPVILALMVVATAIVYYFAPDVEQDWKWITPGSVFAVVAWILASLGFSYYVNNFGSYNKTYGSIGAVIVLLTWMYLTALFLLVGGEINAKIEHASPKGKAPGQKKLTSSD